MSTLKEIKYHLKQSYHKQKSDPLTYPTPYPTPYPTIPLSCHTLPYPTLPSTLPSPPLYPTLPYTLPYPKSPPILLP